ncbi:MAG: hypothetical protein ACYC3G_00590 [Minisyncoccota bacterium]
MAGKDWIQGAIKRPGALTDKARRAGALSKQGDIKVGWLREQAKKNTATGRQARLSLTLRNMNKKGGKS